MQIRIRLQPKASADRIDAVSRLSDGGWLIRAKVTAVPEMGKANDALIALLAKQWHVRKSGITLCSGETDRNKVIGIADDLVALVDADLERRLAAPPIAEQTQTQRLQFDEARRISLIID
jgi:uncharacterized protein YggU (UPF0235/DUF167 family)